MEVPFDGGWPRIKEMKRIVAESEESEGRDCLLCRPEYWTVCSCGKDVLLPDCQ